MLAMARAQCVCTLWIGILLAAYSGFADDFALILDVTGVEKHLYTEADSLPAQRTFFENRRPLPSTAAASPDFHSLSTQSVETQSIARNEPFDRRLSENFHDTAIPSTGKSAVAAKPSSDSTLPYNFISNADEKQIEMLVLDASAANSYSDANAVVLWEVEVLHINEDASAVFSTRRIVKILNEGGYKFGGVSIPYTRGDVNITVHHARSITPDGQVFELDQRKIVKDIPPPSAVERGLFVDARLMHFAIPKMSAGCIIDYAYSSKKSGSNHARRILAPGLLPNIRAGEILPFHCASPQKQNALLPDKRAAD